MASKYTLRIVLPLLIVFVSCTPIELKQVDDDVPVIEGYISPGNLFSVLISRQVAFADNDTNIYYIDSLDIDVLVNDEAFTLQWVDSGLYINEQIVVEEEDVVELSFEYHGKTVSASTVIPGKPENFVSSAYGIAAVDLDEYGRPEIPDPIELNWDNDSLEYYMIVVENIESNPTQINEDDDRPPRAFRSSPIQTNEAALNAMDFTYYGNHNVILYKLNAEYAALYEQLESSSTDISAPPSNVENGLGIFTGINADTIRVKVY